MFSGWYDRSKRICKWNDGTVFPMTTAQFPWEIEALAALHGQLHPHLTVEIGSQSGGTLRYWLMNSHYPTDIVCSIDPAPSHDFKSDNLRKFVTRSDDPETIAAIKAMGKIDFLFIDGDHGYEGVKYDFMTYGPMVKTGGVIALHDIATFREDCQVHALWDEIKQAGYLTRELRVAAHIQPYGAGIGIVYL